PAILYGNRQEIPFGRPYRIHPNGWITASPPLSSGSSSGFSSLPSGSSSSTSSSPYAGPSRKRSHISSSSLETSHPSSPPSRKRCRSPTPLLSATTVCTPPIEMLPPYKRLKGSSSAPHDDVHAKTIVEAKLDDHSEMIGEMYEHLLDIPLTRLETIDHALETLRAEVVSTKGEIASSLARARATEQRDEIA
nr:hypothetical protein [Tanacetum cinerariifolium]